ncbi:hypothetical protein TRVA0_026S01728 [Trichomonascus vanleenenianus]|uniref:uncharacterized protein n=1 Tax=Trichomonascus vanleenenianus TaxID=2268995 RepID=UPI003ECBAC7F
MPEELKQAGPNRSAAKRRKDFRRQQSQDLATEHKRMTEKRQSVTEAAARLAARSSSSLASSIASAPTPASAGSSSGASAASAAFRATQSDLKLPKQESISPALSAAHGVATPPSLANSVRSVPRAASPSRSIRSVDVTPPGGVGALNGSNGSNSLAAARSVALKEKSSPRLNESNRTRSEASLAAAKTIAAKTGAKPAMAVSTENEHSKADAAAELAAKASQILSEAASVRRGSATSFSSGPDEVEALAAARFTSDNHAGVEDWSTNSEEPSQFESAFKAALLARDSVEDTVKRITTKVGSKKTKKYRYGLKHGYSSTVSLPPTDTSGIVTPVPIHPYTFTALDHTLLPSRSRSVVNDEVAPSSYPPRLNRMTSSPYIVPRRQSPRDEPTASTGTAVTAPSAGLKKTTMRKTKKRHLFNEDKPWKHHDFSLRVSEVERKRYEGLWATNKGIHVPFVPTDQDEDSEEYARQKESVHGVVVRDLWNRSRLDEDTLEAIWNLVDRRQDGTLDREEFLVGTWLVDQCLYGKKLPAKLDSKVWTSVARLNVDINLFKHKHKHHPHHRKRKESQ